MKIGIHGSNLPFGKKEVKIIDDGRLPAIEKLPAHDDQMLHNSLRLAEKKQLCPSFRFDIALSFDSTPTQFCRRACSGLAA